MPKDKPENNPSSEPLIDMDQFITSDGVSAVWASGLQVYLRSREGIIPRPISAWRKVLGEYQSLS